MNELESRIALRSLVDEYSIAVDAFDAEHFAGLFTEHATFSAVAPGADAPFVSASGVNEIAQIPAQNKAVFEQTFHAVANHCVACAGDRATGTAYCTARHLLRDEDGRREAIVMPIRYRDEYELTPTGWRFASRRIEFTWTERAPVDSELLAAWNN